MTRQSIDRWPSQTELVIGFVAAVGIDVVAIKDQLATVLSRFKYQTHDIHLSEQLRDLDWEGHLVEDPFDERLWSYMSAGNRLCELWDRPDAFGLLAINAITLEREAAGGSGDRPLERHAYVLRSLKRVEEVTFLRNVYGTRFVQVSIYAPEQARLAYLEKRIAQSRIHPREAKPVYSAEQLVRRDQAEAGEHGQNVRGIFHRGDFFIDAMGEVEGQLNRTMEILFGHPNRTPTRDEVGMFHAVAATRRSAELGRQVGAALCTQDGSLVAVGTNEVPKPGGGLYWEGDEPDGREFTKGYDTNDRRKAAIAAVIADGLIDANVIDANAPREQVVGLIASSPLDDLIEFIRAVHAEMAVITDAARRGIAIGGTVLYVTTFPCHQCAGHVVASGVRRVVYVAPYAKSLARELHDDAICVDPAEYVSDRREITFEPFVGVGPGRFLDLFEMPGRKDEGGRVLPFDAGTALPRLAEIEAPEMQLEIQPYVRRERGAYELLDRVQYERAPRLKGYEPGSVRDG